MSIHTFLDLIKKSEPNVIHKTMDKHVSAVQDDLKSVKFWLKKIKEDATFIEMNSNSNDQMLVKKVDNVLNNINTIEKDLLNILNFVGNIKK